MKRRFKQIDVFGRRNFAGNPVAVILDAAGLSSREMAAISRWTNLSETTFVLPPERGGDYRLRIFTPEQELAFGGHPTLGSAHAFLETLEVPRDALVQECGAGLVAVTAAPTSGPGERNLSFVSPPPW
jgi:PhzF family phenazine biosynthesis protein